MSGSRATQSELAIRALTREWVEAAKLAVREGRITPDEVAGAAFGWGVALMKWSCGYAPTEIGRNAEALARKIDPETYS